MRIEFESELFRWESRADDWYFAALPAEASADIREIPQPARGFGSVPTDVAIGGSRWRTSIFPDASRGVYVLPIKRAVRDAEGLGDGDLVHVRLDIMLG